MNRCIRSLSPLTVVHLQLVNMGHAANITISRRITRGSLAPLDVLLLGIQRISYLHLA